MDIIYKSIKNIDIENLNQLFECVDWITTTDRKLVQKALLGASDVFSAWDNDKLIGLVYVIADGAITAHVHYLIVHPEYRNNGIGTTLINMVLEKYKNYVRMYLEARHEKVEFYEKEFGFERITHLNLMEKYLDGFYYLNKK